MKLTEMPLADLAKTLTGRLRFHLNHGAAGHLMVQDILDSSGRVIGGKRTVTEREKKPHALSPKKDRKSRSIVTYFLGSDTDKQFETAERFLKAYQQQLRDKEFEKAAPEKTK